MESDEEVGGGAAAAEPDIGFLSGSAYRAAG